MLCNLPFRRQLPFLVVVLMLSLLSRVGAEGLILDQILTLAGTLHSFVKERRNLCLQRTEMRGFYFARREPCHLTFFRGEEVNGEPTAEHHDAEACNNSDYQIGISFPFWSHNVSEGGDEETELSPLSLSLHFWPDSCVGVRPGCFSLKNVKISTALERWHEDGQFPLIPINATHIRVDCTSDSQTAYDVHADPEFIKNIDIVASFARSFAFQVMMVCLTWAALGCFCCCCCLGSKKRKSPSHAPSDDQSRPLPVQEGVNPDNVNAMQLYEHEGLVQDGLRQGLRHRRPVQ